jgi:hypothetical protein
MQDDEILGEGLLNTMIGLDNNLFLDMLLIPQQHPKDGMLLIKGLTNLTPHNLLPHRINPISNTLQTAPLPNPLHQTFLMNILHIAFALTANNEGVGGGWRFGVAIATTGILGEEGGGLLGVAVEGGCYLG